MNSLEWWMTTKASPEALATWLQKQYRGEVTAVTRLQGLLKRFRVDDHEDLVRGVIVDEAKHARWILDLLQNRGIEATPPTQEERYWPETMKNPINCFQHACAIAYHAEAMRLERIVAICHDVTAPWDIRDTFLRILPDERRHRDGFLHAAGPQWVELTRKAHEEGMNALGLEV